MLLAPCSCHSTVLARCEQTLWNAQITRSLPRVISTEALRTSTALTTKSPGSGISTSRDVKPHFTKNILALRGEVFSRDIGVYRQRVVAKVGNGCVKVMCGETHANCYLPCICTCMRQLTSYDTSGLKLESTAWQRPCRGDRQGQFT